VVRQRSDDEANDQRPWKNPNDSIDRPRRVQLSHGRAETESRDKREIGIANRCRIEGRIQRLKASLM
jgi:hypothetical protein